MAMQGAQVDQRARLEGLLAQLKRVIAKGEAVVADPRHVAVDYDAGQNLSELQVLAEAAQSALEDGGEAVTAKGVDVHQSRDRSARGCNRFPRR